MAKKIKTTKLPEKPSELLKLAMLDLEKVEADPRYRVDMGEWHKPNGRCSVCLAGSVMAKTLGLPPNKDDPFYDGRRRRAEIIRWRLPDYRTSPASPDVDPTISFKLFALDCFRNGDITCAFGYLGIKRPEALPNSIGGELSYMSEDHHRRPQWKNHMADLIGILQAEGL